jgi:hypothetical protein
MCQIFFFRFLLFFICLCLFHNGSNAQSLSDSARISLMTVEPGAELYSSFGHSALRIYDPVNRIDKCYNYGTFDFDQPNFYVNFCRGKLLYSLNLEPTRYFERSNIQDARAMREQVLRLTMEQRQRLFDLLETNALPENRNYKYDFFYDNCATRIRDIVQEAFFYQLQFDTSKLVPGTTMRQLLKPYLKNQPWADFGIDLVLGLPTDRKAAARDFMFLPDWLHDMFTAAKTPQGQSLVQSERNIPEFTLPKHAAKSDIFGRPLWIMGFVAVLGLLSMANPRTERVFDAVFWLILGLAGLIMVLLWFATDHTATKLNFNLLWAWPTHLLFFWRNKRSEWTENYFTGAAAFGALALIFWKWIPQAMPIAAIPIVVLVVIRGLWRRYWKPADEV